MSEFSDVAKEEEEAPPQPPSPQMQAQMWSRGDTSPFQAPQEEMKSPQQGTEMFELLETTPDYIQISFAQPARKFRTIFTIWEQAQDSFEGARHVHISSWHSSREFKSPSIHYRIISESSWNDARIVFK